MNFVNSAKKIYRYITLIYRTLRRNLFRIKIESEKTGQLLRRCGMFFHSIMQSAMWRQRSSRITWFPVSINGSSLSMLNVLGRLPFRYRWLIDVRDTNLTNIVHFEYKNNKSEQRIYNYRYTDNWQLNIYIVNRIKFKESYQNYRDVIN